MSFKNLKTTKPELDSLKKKRSFSLRGENLLDLKRVQILKLLREYSKDYFDLRLKMRDHLLDDIKLLKKSYETIGIRKIKRIANSTKAFLKPEIKITYFHEMGIDVPRIELILPKKQFPTYSYSSTTLYIDILIKRLNEVLKIIMKLAESDYLLYHVAEENKKVKRRIDALDEIIIPRLTASIRTITEVLNDEEREEFIRMKNIKEFLDIEND